MADRLAHRPGRALERERYFHSRERTTEALQPVDAGIAGPADRTGRRRRRDPFVAELMLEKIEQFVTRGRHAADPERHGPNRESFGETHPESMRLLGAERAEAAAPARRAETGFVGRDDRR